MKASALYDKLDFENASNKMNMEQQKWLRNSLEIMFPEGHIWL